VADTEQEFEIGYTSKKRNNKGQELGGTNKEIAASANLLADIGSVGGLRAALTTFSSTTYTTALLNRMTKNDMVYALRLANDSNAIK
jgi:hypothetical protein